MSDTFLDVYLDELIAGFPCDSSPRWATSIVPASSGAERRNSNWANPLRTFRLPEAIREQDTFNTIHDHWLVVAGPAMSWPFRDPMDFASIALDEPNVEPDWSGADQALGTGDGFARTFQLEKTYQRGAGTYTRPIYLPVDGSLDLLMSSALHGGMAPTDPGAVGATFGGPYTWEVSRPGGEVLFTPAPQAGIVMTWGGLFDCEVRFEADDSFEGIVQSYRIAGYADLTFVEVRRC